MYLDNAATSYPKPDTVYQSVLHAMKDVGASPGRGGYRQALEAGRIVFNAREAVAELFSISDSSRIIFTQNATGALNLALYGTLNPGDHVITTTMEHNSLLRPLYALKSKSVDVTIVPAGSDGIISVDKLRKAIRKNTKIIAVAHVSNVCGAIQPIESIAALCREFGVLFLLDAAQSAGHLTIDAEALPVDLLAAPGHKGLLAPSGTGILYVAPSVAIKPVVQGGTGTASTAIEQPVTFPDGFEAGTHNLSGIAGLLAGVEFIKRTGVSAIHKHEQTLLEQADRELNKISGLTIYGPKDSSKHCSVISFTVDAVDASLLAAELDHHFDIAVRSGLHCAPLAHRTLGTLPGGTVRLSPGWFNTSEDIAFFSDAVVQCVNKIRKAI